MTPRRVLGVCAAITLAALLAWRFSAARSPQASRAARAFELSAAAPELSAAQLTESLDASDELVDRLREEGVAEPGVRVREVYETATVTEAEARAFYGANIHRFAGRSFDSSRTAVERLLRIHRTRVALGIRSPENGLVHEGE